MRLYYAAEQHTAAKGCIGHDFLFLKAFCKSCKFCVASPYNIHNHDYKRACNAADKAVEHIQRGAYEQLPFTLQKGQHRAVAPSHVFADLFASDRLTLSPHFLAGKQSLVKYLVCQHSMNMNRLARGDASNSLLHEARFQPGLQ